MPEGISRVAILLGPSPMLSDLFVVVSDTHAGGVLDWVPPTVRQPVRSPAEIRREGADIVIECSALRPRRPGRHFVPSFSALTTAEYSFRFEAASVVRPEDWTGTVSVGPATFGSIPGGSASLRSEVDLFVTDTPLESLRLRLRLRATDLEVILGSRWMITLSACDGEPAESRPSLENGPAAIPVPALSQLEEDAGLRDRICSPTSVAMVLGYWRRAATVAELAAEMFHPRLDLYGVWPAAIQAGARRGVPGYLLRFPDWATATWCLSRGLPIVASVRYETGELTNAAITRTSGHLLVLTGFEGSEVLVNDPVAPTRATVPRRYRLDELSKIWLSRSGVGYVFCPPP